MDRKTIIVIVCCLLLLVGWNALVNHFFPPLKPQPGLATNEVATLTSPAATNVADTSSVPVLSATPVQADAARVAIDTNVPEQLITLTNENARYTFTSHGGGLKLVELIKYPEEVGRKRGQPASERLATLNRDAFLPTLAVLDGEMVQGNGIFQLSATGNVVRAEKLLPNGLSIVKEFTLSTNYLVLARVQLQNTSDQPLTLPEQRWVVGTATPMNSQDNGNGTVGWMWHDGGRANHDFGSSYFSRRNFACMPRTPPEAFIAGENNIAWAAVFNQFFTIAAIAQSPASRVMAREVDLPAPTPEQLRENPGTIPAPKGYETYLVYPGVSLAPDQTVTREFQLYAGPKEYRTLARIGQGLDAIMKFGRFFGFFSKALLLGMNKLHDPVGLSYGWAIIVITIIIKLLFWPLTQASTRSMKRMQALQPQMKAIQEKYKDDPVKAQRKLMEFMKENKVNPMGGCIPMLLQMPVFIGFFYMIRSAIELRGASFLWVHDLSRPDTLFYIGSIPFNLLPLLMGATMLWQSHLTPPSPGMDPVQQRMLRYMPLIFVVFLYNFSAGLTLYWTVQNLLTILQTKLTKTLDKPEQPAAPSAKAPPLTPGPKKKKQGRT